MAAPANPDAVPTATDAAAPAGGETLSKNEQKRRAKAAAKEAEAAAKAAAKAAAPAPAGGAKKKPDEEELDPSAYRANRFHALEVAAQAGLPMYPHKFEVSLRLPEFVEKYNHLAKNERIAGDIVTVAGRIMRKADSGAALCFYTLQGDGATIQVFAEAGSYANAAEFERINDLLRRGDIIGVRGFPCRTNPKPPREGELSIVPLEIVLLSPCYHMLPGARKNQVGLTNVETRYRQRYLDLMMNKSTRDIFIMRSRIVTFVRRFYENYGFLEVETPLMNMIPGGAAAKPFVTHHNDLKMDLYMRIAPELFLKRLVIGGLDRVFEIGRCFRNEGIDMTHNPEFTMCEAYMAYADYKDIMRMTEELISTMVFQLTGSYIVKYHAHGKDKDPIEINFARPWGSFSMCSSLEEKLGVKLPKDLESDEANAFLRKLCLEHKVICTPPLTTTRLLDKLVGHFIEPLCVNPTFITDHPQIMSPLAKNHRSLHGMTERFELFINGREVCNAYTELNNPVVQRERFTTQGKDVAAGDDEAMCVDEEFCTSLEYGLPPTGGWGMGLDRFTMLLTDTVNIQEVLLFPAMKPDDQEAHKPQAPGAAAAAAAATAATTSAPANKAAEAKP